MSIKDYKFSFDRRKIGLLASLFILFLSLGQLAWTLRADNVVPKVQVDIKKSLRAMSWNWFGNVKEVPTINTNYEDQPLQEIDINADLLGVMLSENNSSATLKFQGRPEKVFKIGDKLSGSIELVEIQAYRIIVQDKGIRKQLLMKKHDVIMESSYSEGANESKIRQEGFAIANLFGAVPVKVNEDQGFKV
ncbi:MAG: type II secretion system protein N, partial [Pseudomonadota bacterium]|nr:type II secretion system protein N [Pseudomonadota bacterium]